MAKNYQYKETRNITKKIIGVYNSTDNTIEVDGEAKNIIDELKDFSDEVISITITLKDESDLADE